MSSKSNERKKETTNLFIDHKGSNDAEKKSFKVVYGSINTITAINFSIENNSLCKVAHNNLWLPTL